MTTAGTPGVGDGPPVYACIAGGGTGGHVVPMLAIARALAARGHEPASLVFVGSERGIERDLVPEAGFPLVTLPGRGIPRRLSLEAVRAALSIVAGVVRGIGVVRRLRPRVVVAVGGYAAVPCIIGAVLWRVPLVVVARDARVGAADRLAGRFAAAAAVPFPGTDLPRAVVTGNPVRAEVLEAAAHPDPAGARTALDLPDHRVVVGVFTGSLGSRRVNEAVLGLAERWRDRGDVAIRHVVGTRDWDDLQDRLPAPIGADEPTAGRLVYQAVRFEDRMQLLLSAADVAVTRAGGATVAELAVVGVPAVLVPLPIATRDHQTANARVLADAGAAVLVPDDELDTDRLAAELGPLVDDATRRREAAAAARRLGRPDAAERVADLIEEHAHR